MKKPLNLFVGASAIAMTCGSVPAIAQQAAAPAANTAALEEIVVTAQKRSERLQDVPIAVTALTASKLESGRIQTTQDLQFSEPSLIYNQVGAFAVPYMRGIGSDFTMPNTDPSVATYVDGVFISNSSSTILGLLGTERIEILQGPQGTLYGRNAVAGAINVITLSPKDEMEARLSATAGNYHRFEGNGYISGPVSDKLFIGIYAGGSTRDSFIKRRTPAGSNLDEPQHETNIAGRLKAVWVPTDDLKITGTVEGYSTRSFEAGAFRNIQPNALGYAFGAPQVIQKYVYSYDYPQTSYPTSFSYTLRGELDLGWAQLLSISAGRRFIGGSSDDLDGTQAPLLAASTASQAIQSRQFSQEVQLLSPTSSSIKWIVGGYFFRERSGFYPQINDSGVLFGPPVTRIVSHGQVNTKSYAAFAQATVPIFDKLRLTLGGRYLVDHKHYFDGDVIFTDAAGSNFGAPIVVAQDRHTWHKFTPKVTLDYRVGNTLLYATYSQGFKSGAYNVSSALQAAPPVNPEKLTQYEIGTKSDFLNGRVRLNTSAFYYDLSNQQVQRSDVSSGGAVTLQNVPGSKIYGAEGNLTVAATQHLTLNSSVSYLHSKYKTFTGAASYILGPAGNPAALFDVTGNQLTRAPRWVVTGGFNYSQPLANGGKVDLDADVYHNGGFYWEVTNRFRQPAYTIVNASLGYTFPDQHFQLRAFVTNLTNQYYATSLVLVPVGVITQDAPPRMFGVTGTWHL